MIGSDLSMKPLRANPSPSPVQAAQPGPPRMPRFGGDGGQSRSPNPAVGGSPPPQYIDIDTTEDAVNNVIAEGVQHGDQRYQVKQMDRAGVSRGRGQEYMAAQEGQRAMGKAAGQAAQIRMEDQKQNAQMRADYERMKAQEQMSAGMAAHAMGEADWSVDFARQQAAMDMLREALMGPGYQPRKITNSSGRANTVRRPRTR